MTSSASPLSERLRYTPFYNDNPLILVAALPNECLRMVFSNLSLRDTRNASLVCKTWEIQLAAAYPMLAPLFNSAAFRADPSQGEKLVGAFSYRARLMLRLYPSLSTEDLPLSTLKTLLVSYGSRLEAAWGLIQSTPRRMPAMSSLWSETQYAFFTSLTIPPSISNS